MKYYFARKLLQQRHAIVVDREHRLNAAYSSSYSQACLLLQAIQMNGRRRLSSECILQLASFVARAWESNPEQDKIDALAKLMTNLMDTTLLCPEKPFDEALKQFCRNNIPTHSVSPSITLLIAIGYIERLKQKYHNIKGTRGCGHRLILVAYMMAAKFMHVNLRSIISTSTTSPSASASTSACTSPMASPTSLTPFSNNMSVSAERSTIHKYTPNLPPISATPKHQEQPEQLPSPPTSPKSFASDPLHYHYFQSTNNASSTTNNTIHTANSAASQHANAAPAPVNHNERHFQILRMELEFLHFLNYDLSLSDTLKLIHWAQKFDDDLLPPIQNKPASGDEGGNVRSNSTSCD
ncbi:hypothetical protein FB192DRAFT_1426859 [Mucor lusitanicus]|uniref:Cyclin N-terminal domain-containing protein n=1 Tax=Mucor circinelloides f. lusitanicus TaxID=29924 RepID=A0A8H4F584_MUCCL|nr:hypothetical protein FB192DRAFT_1426859 [Mucor lusitanicus]